MVPRGDDGNEFRICAKERPLRTYFQTMTSSMVRTNPKRVKPVTRSVKLPKILRTASKSCEEDFRAFLGLLGENEGRLQSSGDEFENSKDEIQTVNRASGRNSVRKSESKMLSQEDHGSLRVLIWKTFQKQAQSSGFSTLYQHSIQATLETWAVAFKKGNLESLCN